MADRGALAIAPAGAGASAVILVAAIVLFGLTTRLPFFFATAVGAAGAAAAIVLRVVSSGRSTDAATLLILLVLGVLAATAPDSRGAGLAGGIVILALLLWLADEPGRVRGGMRRAATAVGVVGLAFAVAWASAFLIPLAVVPTGVIGGLLVVVILLATTLFARPDILEREPPLAS